MISSSDGTSLQLFDQRRFHTEGPINFGRFGDLFVSRHHYSLIEIVRKFSVCSVNHSNLCVPHVSFVIAIATREKKNRLIVFASSVRLDRELKSFAHHFDLVNKYSMNHLRV